MTKAELLERILAAAQKIESDRDILLLKIKSLDSVIVVLNNIEGCNEDDTQVVIKALNLIMNGVQ